MTANRMVRGARLFGVAAMLMVGVTTTELTWAGQLPADAQRPTATFKAGVDLVTIRAVVRDSKGRPVTNLRQAEFQVIDNGATRPISAFERDTGPMGVALLFDVSGSMDISERFDRARETGYFVLSGLRAGKDEAAIFAFDSGLHEVQPFTTEIGRLQGRLTGMDPFGMTSLFDAIADSSRKLVERGARRRALVVMTDGLDNGSLLTPAEVSRIASSIDLPVYVVAVLAPVDDPRNSRQDDENQEVTNLENLARWTGGALFLATTTAEASQVARQITNELSEQYLIAFEPGAGSGWHSVEVRTRNKNHTVQARGGYMGGSRPPS
jgi:VWFA-related protein